MMESRSYNEQQTPLDLLSKCAMDEMENTSNTNAFQHVHVTDGTMLCAQTQPNNETMFYLDNRGSIVDSNGIIDDSSITTNGDSNTTTVVHVEDSPSLMPINGVSLKVIEHAVHIDGEITMDQCMTTSNTEDLNEPDSCTVAFGAPQQYMSTYNSLGSDDGTSTVDTLLDCVEREPSQPKTMSKRKRRPTHKGLAHTWNISKHSKDKASVDKIKKEPTDDQNIPVLYMSSTKDHSNRSLTANKRDYSSHVKNGERQQYTQIKRKKRRRKQLLADPLSTIDEKRYEKIYSRRTNDASKGRGQQTTFYCIKCPSSFSRLTQLKAHFRTHAEDEEEEEEEEGGNTATKADHKKRVFWCNDCGAVLNTLRLLKSHQQQEHNTTSSSLECKLCSSTFSHAASYKVHMRAHRGEKPYQCTECEAEFVQSGHLMIHKRIHTGEKPYTCVICNVQFKQISHLKTHVRTHTLDKPYKCDECDAAFAQNSSLKRHKRSHSGEKPYKCIVCDMTFVVKSNLQRHTYTHTGEKPYSCSLCSASFGQVIDLKRHEISHTGIKPYKCDLCEAQFSRNNNLKWHRLTHADGASHKCEICEVPFATPGDLRFHRRSHEPPRPFQCHTCPASFQQSCSLANHQLIHTSKFPTNKKVRSKTKPAATSSTKTGGAGKPFPCNLCSATFCEKRSWRRHFITVHTDASVREQRAATKIIEPSGRNVNVHVLEPDHVEQITKFKEENVSVGLGSTDVDSPKDAYTISYESNGAMDVDNSGHMLEEVLSTATIDEQQEVHVISGLVNLQQQQQHYQQLLQQQEQQLSVLRTETSANSNAPGSINVVNGATVGVGAVLVNSSSLVGSMDQHFQANNNTAGIVSQLVISTGPDEPARQAKPAGNCPNHSSHILTLIDPTSNHWQAWCLCDQSSQPQITAVQPLGLVATSLPTQGTMQPISALPVLSSCGPGLGGIITPVLGGSVSVAASTLELGGCHTQDGVGQQIVTSNGDIITQVLVNTNVSMQAVRGNGGLAANGDSTNQVIVSTGNVNNQVMVSTGNVNNQVMVSTASINNQIMVGTSNVNNQVLSGDVSIQSLRESDGVCTEVLGSADQVLGITGDIAIRSVKSVGDATAECSTGTAIPYSAGDIIAAQVIPDGSAMIMVQAVTANGATPAGQQPYSLSTSGELQQLQANGALPQTG